MTLRNTHRKALFALLTVTAGSLTGLYAGAAQAGVFVDVDVAPPPARLIVAPPPRFGYVWAPGYWRWEGGRHIWHRGCWIRERHGRHWGR
jgi:WXXGXW repeat (2 copies)